ncbi:hypothetical protein FACS189465_3420 [Clostridia bacterium]|nr:hypothetical protein FACS189465_3420 [Clostridia bacterium]
MDNDKLSTCAVENKVYSLGIPWKAICYNKKEEDRIRRHSAGRKPIEVIQKEAV